MDLSAAGAFISRKKVMSTRDVLSAASQSLIDRIPKGKGAPLADQGILRRTWPRGATAAAPQIWLIGCKGAALKSGALPPGFVSDRSAERGTFIGATTTQALRTNSKLMALQSLQDVHRHREETVPSAHRLERTS